MPCASVRSSSTAASASTPIASSVRGQILVVSPSRASWSLHLDRHQPLLCPIVEILLETASLAIGRLDETRARRAQLVDEARVLEQHQRARSQSLDNVGVGVERRIMDQGRHGTLVPGDLGHTAHTGVARKLERRTAHVDVPSRSGAHRASLRVESPSASPINVWTAARSQRLSTLSDNDLAKSHRREQIPTNLAGAKSRPGPPPLVETVDRS